MILHRGLPRAFAFKTCRFSVWAAMVFAVACSGGADPIPWNKIIPSETSAETAVPPRTSDHLVVYLDTSASMSGYVSPDGTTSFGVAPDGQTVFSRTLQELRSVGTTFNPQVDVVFRKVDSTVGQPVFNDMELSKASVNRGLYSGGETNLAGAINAFDDPLKLPAPAPLEKSGEGDESDDEPPPPARFHVLITDGVQSTKQERVGDSCVSGSDFRCVQKGVAALLKKGWAGSVLGVRSEFRGKVYSEMRPGTSLQYESKRKDPKTFRPFYLYVFSPDPAANQKLVNGLKSRLREMLGQEEAVREYALTSNYTEGPPSADIQILKEARDYLERTKAKEESPPRLTLRVDLDAEKAGPQPFDVLVSVPWSRAALDGGSPQELASMLRWQLVPLEIEGASSDERARYPEVRLTGQESGADGQVVIRAQALWPQGTGTPAWRAYRLEGRLDLEKKTPPWVEQWSTNNDTTADAATRTLNIASSLAGLWRNPAIERQTIAAIYLRVGPQ